MEGREEGVGGRGGEGVGKGVEEGMGSRRGLSPLKTIEIVNLDCYEIRWISKLKRKICLPSEGVDSKV